MKAPLSAFRAVTALYAQQFIRPFFIWSFSILSLLLLLDVWLGYHFSSWLWLIAIPLILLGGVDLVLWLTIAFIVRRIAPHLNREQRTASKQFIAKIQRLSDVTHTPYPFIVINIIKDLLFGHKHSYIQGIMHDSKTLTSDFDDLQKLF
jgi:hypothetical protein